MTNSPYGGNRELRANFAAYIRDNTRDGKDLIEFVLAILHGRVRGVDSKKLQENVWLRLQAADWLATRGWGKPPQSVELEFINSPFERELKGLTVEQLRAVLREIDARDSMPIIEVEAKELEAAVDG